MPGATDVIERVIPYVPLSRQKDSLLPPDAGGSLDRRIESLEDMRRLYSGVLWSSDYSRPLSYDPRLLQASQLGPGTYSRVMGNLARMYLGPTYPQ